MKKKKSNFKLISLRKVGQTWDKSRNKCFYLCLNIDSNKNVPKNFKTTTYLIFNQC